MERLPYRKLRHFPSMAEGSHIENKGDTGQRREKITPLFYVLPNIDIVIVNKTMAT